MPVIADGLFTHDQGDFGNGRVWETDITIPNKTCEACTLQILEFMTPHSIGCFYHHCANLKIVAYPNAHHGFDSPNQGKLVLTGLRSTKSGTATIGTDPEARADVLKRVPEILAAMQGR